MFYRLHVKGAENVPKTGPFIIASNHASNLDPLIVGASCRPKIHYLAKEELFKNKLLCWYLGKLNTIPVNRNSADTKALRAAIKKLHKKQGVLIFPEGTRTRDGNLQEGKLGIAIMSYLTKAPVIPCYVKGSYDIWPVNARFPRKGRLDVAFGKTIPSLGLVSADKKESYYAFSQKIIQCIKDIKESNEAVS